MVWLGQMIGMLVKRWMAVLRQEELTAVTRLFLLERWELRLLLRMAQLRDALEL